MHARLEGIARRLAWALLVVASMGLGAPAQAARHGLPAAVQSALDRAHVPRSSLAVVVEEVGADKPALEWRADASMNPASLMKLVTTAAALDLLGPAWVWSTPVWLQGQVRNPGSDGVLDGDLVIKGGGDPKLVMERVWLLLRRVRQLGVREIHGDIVLDRSAFAPAGRDAAAFDGDGLRPYNVQPDALLINFRSVLATFTPDIARGVAVISTDPPMAGVSADVSVPLGSEPCGDWQAALKADFSDPAHLRFGGRFPLDCGERQWAFAYPDPAHYEQRLLTGMWTQMDGTLSGGVREGVAPASPPTFTVESPPLAEVIRDINKFSNNTMAQQLFLTLGLAQQGIGSPQTARQAVAQWVVQRFGALGAALTIDNGSGLSRDGRLSAALLARLLQQAWSSPVMSELMSSLPVMGVDGTLRRVGTSPGQAHLKTGTLRDVTGVAGFVLANSGKRYVLVAIVNDANARDARPAFEALVEWVTDGAPRWR